MNIGLKSIFETASKEKRGTFSHGRSIEKRPHKVETRQEFGHFEADTVLSGKRKGWIEVNI